MPIHHIIPRHEWKKRFGNLKGLGAPDNLIELTTEQHAEVHMHYYREITHNHFDRLASEMIRDKLVKRREHGHQSV